MKSLKNITAWIPIALFFGSGAAVAQSANAYKNANCNASFQSCSGGGSSAPFGDLGSSGLEVLLVVAVILLLAWRPLRRGLRRG